MELSKLKIFGISQIGNFWSFQNWRFMEFWKLEICGIHQIGKLTDF